jgi:TolA-binding protein
MVCFSACAHNPESFYFGKYSEAEKLYNKGKYQEAIGKYQAYLDENTQGNLAVISNYYIAKSYVALGKPEQAKPIFEKIIKENPDVIWANFSKTQLAEMEGKPADAESAGNAGT